MTPSQVAPMECTGERMTPEAVDAETFWEHVYRYRFAAQYVRNRRVLDIACGEGYGSAALLQAGARSLIGIDIAEDACRHARRRYGIDARVGDAENIPLPDRSVDVVVSFETIEHVPHPERFVLECARVLVPGGTLVISTPNREVFHREITDSNPFHCSEMDESEFRAALSTRFPKVRLYSQRVMTAYCWSLCSLGSEYSPWLRVRGFRRVKNKMRYLWCRHLLSERIPEYREHVVETILSAPHPLAFLIDPYMVRKRSTLSREVPLYVLAVANL